MRFAVGALQAVGDVSERFGDMEVVRLLRARRAKGRLALHGRTVQASYDLRESLALDEVHRVVRRTVFDAESEDVHDARVIELPGILRLPHEAREGLVVGGQARRQDLERDAALHRALPGFVDDTHAAATDLPEEFVVAQRAQLGVAIPLGVEVDKQLDLFDQAVGYAGMSRDDVRLVELFSAVEAIELLGDKAIHNGVALAIREGLGFAIGVAGRWSVEWVRTHLRFRASGAAGAGSPYRRKTSSAPGAPARGGAR